RQQELLDDAKSQGIAKGVIKKIVKARALEQKVRDIYESFEDVIDRAEYVDIRKALGDDFSTLPLGVSAVEREETEKPKGGRRKKPDTAAVVEAATKAWSEADADREAAQH